LARLNSPLEEVPQIPSLLIPDPVGDTPDPAAPTVPLSYWYFKHFFIGNGIRSYEYKNSWKVDQKTMSNYLKIL